MWNKDLRDHANNTIQRIREHLMMLSFYLAWVVGKEHKVTDALSRCSILHTQELIAYQRRSTR